MLSRTLSWGGCKPTLFSQNRAALAKTVQNAYGLTKFEGTLAKEGIFAYGAYFLTVQKVIDQL